MFSTELGTKSNGSYGKNRAGADHLTPVELCDQSTTKITVPVKQKPSSISSGICARRHRLLIPHSLKPWGLGFLLRDVSP